MNFLSLMIGNIKQFNMGVIYTDKRAQYTKI